MGEGTGARTPLLLAAAAMAVVLAWLAVDVNLQRSCVVRDTPYFGLCTEPLDRGPPLRARLAANPGDTRALIELAMTEPPAHRARVLEPALRLAPTDPRLLKLQAASALEQKQVSPAVTSLVNLVEHHADDRAALALARLLVANQSPLLEAQLRPGAHWPERVLAQMSNAGPFAAAMPLVGKALELKALQPEAVAAYVSRLKAAGAWTDAYSLWLTLHRQSLPLVYNGSFDQPFVANGFDWEPNALLSRGRAGAIVDRAGADERGAILDVRFTGRAIATPMVRQYVFIGDGKYRLSGEYRASQLRIEQGLAWKVRCIGKEPAVVGASPALGDTSNVWRQFQFEFNVPAACGNVASLELDTLASLDAAVGGRGRVWFDNFKLERVLN